MPETQDNAFMRFLNEKLVPFSTKVSQNKSSGNTAGSGGSIYRQKAM